MSSLVALIEKRGRTRGERSWFQLNGGSPQVSRHNATLYYENGLTVNHEPHYEVSVSGMLEIQFNV